MRFVSFGGVLTLAFCLLGNGCSKGITRATAATVFFVRGNVFFGDVQRNDLRRVTSKSKIHDGDVVRTLGDASIDLALIPGVFVQMSGDSELKIEALQLTKDGNETAGGMLDRRASVRLNRGKIVTSFSESAKNGSQFGITAGQITLTPDSDCLFSVSSDGTSTRATCGRGKVKLFVDAEPPIKIAAGYFCEWPTVSREPNVATADARAQMDIKSALDVEQELLDQAAGWQNRRVF